MKIDCGDMSWNKEKHMIDFCGDSFYGYWTISEFEEFIEGLKKRLEEIKNESRN